MIAETVRKTFEYLRHRKTAYQLCFGSPAGQRVLLDLAQFCRAHETCLHPNPTVQAALEGRREVWLRIQQHLSLSPTELLALFAQTQLQVVQGDKDA